MARGRDIKPGFFISDELAEVSRDCRLLFIGLWTLADREGRLELRPMRIKAQVFPYDADVTAASIEEMLRCLQDCRGRFVQLYERNGERFVLVRNFKKHQHIHPNEKPSLLPAPTCVPVIPGNVQENQNQSGNSALPSVPSSLPPVDPTETLPRDPCATSTQDLAPSLHAAGAAIDAAMVDSGSKLPGAHDWLNVFSAKYWPTRAKQYGGGEADARACGRFGEYLESLPDSQRMEDWAARDRIVTEFLSSTDKATVAAGWPFSFFAAAFRGLVIPPDKRPRPAPIGRPQTRSVAVGHYEAPKEHPTKTGRMELP